eukprot:Gb_03649 [translate_table: standard]
MGGGNGQKAKMAREKNLEKSKAPKALPTHPYINPAPYLCSERGMSFVTLRQGSQLDSNKKAMSIQCKVCMQTFICTTSEVKCREHAEAKHPKADIYQCFPHLKK